ncbi:MAG: hypothetical protein RLZZ46_1508 [Bacteroidota bacterium]
MKYLDLHSDKDVKNFQDLKLMEEFVCADAGVRVFLRRYEQNQAVMIGQSVNDLSEGSLKKEKSLQHIISREMAALILPSKLSFTEKGKPFSEGLAGISISHTGGLVGLMTSEYFDCGLDLERVSEKAIRVKMKFMSTNEETITGQYFSPNEAATLVWSFKEACYKLHGKGGIPFLEGIFLREIDIINSRLRGGLNDGNKIVWVSGFFRFFEGMVLVYVIPEAT